MRSLRFLAILLLLSGAAVLTAETRDELYARAEAARQAGRSQEAVDLYTEVLRLSPDEGHTYVRRAVCLFELGRFLESAIDECRAHALFVQTEETKQNRALTLANRAESCRRAGFFAGAFADAFAASKVDDQYAGAYVQIADAWYAVGNATEANAFFEKAKARNTSAIRAYTAEGAAANGRGRTPPNDKADTDADFNAAVAAYNAKDYAKALELYDRIVAVKPLNSGAWGNRGNALRALKRHAEAILSHSHAAALVASMGGGAADLARHYGNRANSWLDLGEPDAAVVDTALATKANPDSSWVWQRRAAALYAWGDYEGAVAAVAEAKQRDASFKGYDHTAEGAASNRFARLARRGDRAAARSLVDQAKSGGTTLFGNPYREKAVTVLDELLAARPRDVELLLLRAEAEDAGFGFGSSPEAIAFADRAIEIDPHHGPARRLRALLRLDHLVGDEATRAAAYADLDKAIELGAGTPELFEKRASHRSEQKDYAGAASDLTAALRLKPDDVELLAARARVHEQREDWAAALADRDRVIAARPAEARGYLARAELHLARGAAEAAVADFTAAIARRADDPDAYLGRAAAHRRLQKLDAAKADHALARQHDRLLPALAADWSNADEIEALRKDLGHAMKRVGEAMGAVNAAATEMLRAQQEKDRAEARLRRLFDGDDRTPEEILDEVSGREKDGWADAEDYRDRAQAHLRKDNVDAAVADLDRAIQLDDKHAGAFDTRGRIRESRGDFDGAFADYERAIELAPGDADYRRDRGDIWWERGDMDAAFADYSKAVELAPKQAVNWFKRGNAQFRRGRFPEAVADYDRALELDPQLKPAADNREVARRRLAAAAGG